MSEPLYRSQSDSWHGHQKFAIELVKTMKPHNIVELGVQWGDSYFSFCQGVKEGDIPCWTFGIDTWKGDPHSGEYGEDIFKAVNEYNHQHYSEFSLLIRSTFSDARPKFQEKSIDILHIDGYHTYEAVSNDFYEWQYTLSDRGILLFHDTCVPHFGVGKFFDEQKKNFKHFEFEHSNGLGILVVGKKTKIHKLEQVIKKYLNY